MNHPLNTAAFYRSKPFWEDRQFYLLEGRHYSKVSFLLRDSLKKRMESLLIGDLQYKLLFKATIMASIILQEL